MEYSSQAAKAFDLQVVGTWPLTVISSHIWQSREDEVLVKSPSSKCPVGCSLYLADSMRLSDLKASYPEFQEIYRNYFQGARFDTVSRRDGDFGARKLRLVSVQHLLGKHQRLRRKKRAKLVQSLLRGDFDRAQRIPEEPKRSSVVFIPVASAFGACSPPPSSDEIFKRRNEELFSPPFRCAIPA